MLLLYTQDLITLKHFFKTQAQPESSTYKALLEDPLEVTELGRECYLHATPPDLEDHHLRSASLEVSNYPNMLIHTNEEILHLREKNALSFFRA